MWINEIKSKFTATNMGPLVGNTGIISFFNKRGSNALKRCLIAIYFARPANGEGRLLAQLCSPAGCGIQPYLAPPPASCRSNGTELKLHELIYLQVNKTPSAIARCSASPTFCFNQIVSRPSTEAAANRRPMLRMKRLLDLPIKHLQSR